MFSHVAAYQAPIAAADILGLDGPSADHRAVPRVTFTDPEVGSVGLTEAAARERGLRVRIGIAHVPSTARGWLHRAGNEGVIKLVEDADRGVLVGATSVGPAGGEVLGALSLAVHAEVPTETSNQMIFAYPHLPPGHLRRAAGARRRMRSTPGERPDPSSLRGRSARLMP